jgi:uncharacterized protein YecE (DUF72 family)
MSQLPLFHDPDDLPEQAARLAPKLRAMAEQGVYFGGSSWKYEGWLGTIYNPENYQTRGKFSTRKFEDECLREYARVFPCVCGDFSFYQFPTAQYWERLFGSVPAPFVFGLKVPEDITVARWPSHARYGTRAGKDNPAFLDPKTFERLFARPLLPYSDRVAALIFEFGTIAKSVVSGLDEFSTRLDGFLRALPETFRYAVEIRNPEYLKPRYFDILHASNVAHVFNAWTRMPEIIDQLDLPGASTADFLVARALLRRGRPYAEAVDAFQPYQTIQEVQQPVRDGLRRIVEIALERKKPAFLFINNRLEGHAPSTIEAIVDSSANLSL